MKTVLSRLIWRGLVRNWLRLAIPLVMLASIPVLASFRPNAYQVAIQDLVLSLAVAWLVALLATTVFQRLWRRNSLAGLAGAALATMLLTNNYESRFSGIYGVIGAANPFGPLGAGEGLVYSLVFMAAIIAGSWYIGSMIARRAAIFRIDELRRALMIAITVAFMFQFIPAARFLARAWPQYFYHPSRLASLPASAQTAEKPDIYYIVLDRYASQSVMSRQLGYSNDDFIDYLETNGFYTNPEGHNAYPYTTMSIASTFIADYHGRLIDKFAGAGSQTVIPYHRIIYEAPVVQALQDIGYRYQGIGNWYDSSNKSAIADDFYQDEGILTVLGRRLALGNFASNQFASGPFYRLANSGLRLGDQELVGYTGRLNERELPNQLDQLKSLASQPPGGRFIFAHLLIPHDPYYFNADGSISAYRENDNVGEAIGQKYLRQVEYINGQIKQVLTQIKENSAGRAVVVLQADEGPYPMTLNRMVFNSTLNDAEVNNDDMRQWSDADLAMKFGNLSAYLVPGATASELKESGDPVNIFRMVLSHYFDAPLAPLPRCVYAYPHGRAQPFVYADITQRLAGMSGATCK